MEENDNPHEGQAAASHASGDYYSYIRADRFFFLYRLLRPPRPSEMTVRSLGPKPDWISGSGFGFEVDIGII